MISEQKKRIVIDNYFKRECDVNTSLKQAFIKGFELGLKKAPLDRWIPVSERLPDKKGEYLVTVKKGYITFGIWVGEAENWAQVTAWMPLPQPYKAESEGEE